MKRFILSILLVLPGMFCLGVPQSKAAVIVDPALVSGSDAIDPAGEQTVDQTAPGAVSMATLEAVPELAAVQDFTGWGIVNTTTYIVFSDPSRPDVMGTYSNITGATAGGATSSTSYNTSPGDSIRLNSGSTKAGTLTLTFGSATYDGTNVTAFDTTAMTPTAVGFTICGLANVTTNVAVNFYGTDDTTLLTTQTLTSGTDPDSGDGATGGSDGYVGYIATGTGVASGIGKVTVVTNQVVGSSSGIAIDDLAFNTAGKSYYMTMSGSGAKTGTSWATALSGTSMSTIVNSTMLPGDRLYLGSSNYGSGTCNLGGTTNGQLIITSSGTAGRPKYLVGVDTGGGLPVFDSGTANWRRQFPSQGFYNYLVFASAGSPSYWEVDNLVLKDAQKAITSSTCSPHHTGITLNNISISNVEHGMYLYNTDNLTINDCSVVQYTKHGFRLEEGCNTVSFNNCLADLSGSPTDVNHWWDYSENFPEGFVVNNGGAANTNVSFTDCMACNNQKNGQPSGTFWNGDGWDTEANTVGLTFTRCVSLNNEDGGFDSKQSGTSSTTFTDCVAVGNGNNFKIWSGTVSFDNCVSTYCRRPTSTGTNTNTNDYDGLEVVNATVTADYFTFYGDTGTGVVQKSGTGSYNITNSIIAFSGTAGTFKGGSGTFAPSTVTYRPGSGTDPQFINPQPTWSGTGTDMNSQTYTTTKGWYAAP